MAGKNNNQKDPGTPGATPETKSDISAVAQKLIDDANTEIEKLQAENSSLKEELATLSAELDSIQKSANAGYVTVKSGKKIYRVLGKKFVYKNVEYTAEQLVKNPQLVDELIGIGVGFLIEEKGESK